MKTQLQKLGFVLVFGAAALLTSSANDATPDTAFAPEKIPVDRYRALWENSPFVSETPTVKESPGLAQRFVLTGVASLQGEPVIFVLDRQSLIRSAVTSKPDPQGLALITTNGETDPKKSTATVRLGSETGIISYDLAALQSVNQSPENATAPPNITPTTPPQIQPNPEKTPPPVGRRIIRRKKSIQLSQ